MFQLDHVVRGRVLESLKQAVATAASLARELRELAGGGAGNDVTLARFLDESGRDVEDVYRVGGWTTLRARAGVGEKVDEATEDLSRRLDWLLHTDDATRLAVWKNAVGADLSAADPVYARRLTMLDFQLNHRGVLRDSADVASWLFERAPIREELSQLADVLTERIGLADERYPVAEWPLALHRHYTRREIVAGVGFVKPGKKGVTPQSGILMLPDEKREVLFVTRRRRCAPARRRRTASRRAPCRACSGVGPVPCAPRPAPAPESGAAGRDGDDEARPRVRCSRARF